MKIVWNKVTRFSATLALVLFLALPFYGFWLGSVYGSTKQYERDTLAESQKSFFAPAAAATKVINYIPPAPRESATVVAGSCWTNSIAAPYRDDAWRCMIGNEIYDPCFQIPGNANLRCNAGPKDATDPSSIILSLTKPLPKTEGHLAPATPYDGAWLIELKGGIVCSPFTGTLPFSDKGGVATYGCSDKRLIFGINADGKVWTAKVGSLGTATESAPPHLINQTTVPIATAWK
jgi:hypothetical protein